ncbi:MAG TPA: 5-(carboxyamino)imidazole ribonucleotide synthase [Kofleriaceae bacterium]|jgi:5-(carboxyamino)imidazole ribonucleotide synthase
MTMIGPGGTIGVLGGGQLGRMMALAARHMGYRIVVLDPSARCPTAQVADGVVVGALDDREAAVHLAKQSDVITLDTEHVPADILDELERHAPVRPGAAVLRTIQDRQTQKQFLDRLGIPQARWAPVGSDIELAGALSRFGGRGIVKHRRAGYDGKGQMRVEGIDQLAQVSAWLRGTPAVIEEVVPFAREISAIIARGISGEVRAYPIAENVHRRHILHTTRAPATLAQAAWQHVHDIANSIAEALGTIGVMAVEMFELESGELLVNEIAPRTHNSGHFTWGACATSQFEQHVRAICGLRLGDPRPLSGAVMVNLIGDLWKHGAPPSWRPVLDRPEAHLHLYGKDGAAPGRKMGHVLLVDDDTDRALETAEELIGALTPAP